MMVTSKHTMTDAERLRSAKALAKVVKHFGNINQLIAIVGYDYKAVWKWLKGYQDIPAKHAYIIASIHTVTIEQLRPDLLRLSKKANKKLNKKLDGSL